LVNIYSDSNDKTSVIIKKSQMIIEAKAIKGKVELLKLAEQLGFVS
jgi:hypothetical protein